MFAEPSTPLRGLRDALGRGVLYGHLRPIRASRHLCAGADVQVEGVLWLPGSGRVVIGSRARLLGRRAPIELRAHDGALIWIGDDAVIEAGSSIEATKSVHVGAGARVGAFCKVMDNHFHRTTGDRGERPEPIPVVIGDRTILGPRVVLLPGAVIGEDAWVAPARIVSFRVPAGTPVGARDGAHLQRRVA